MRWRILATLAWLALLVTASDLLRGSAPQGPEPRCGRDFGGIKCDDPKVARYGECCSKYGFCGRKPFHCVERLGCQSTCNNDLDRSPDAVNATEDPSAVVPRPPDINQPRVIIKNIQMAIPMCDACVPKPAPEVKETPAPVNPFTTAAMESMVRAQTLMSLGAPPGLNMLTPGGKPASRTPVPPAAQTPMPISKQNPGIMTLNTMDPDEQLDKEMTEAQRLRKALKDLKNLQAAAEKKAKEIIASAQKAAAKIEEGPDDDDEGDHQDNSHKHKHKRSKRKSKTNKKKKKRRHYKNPVNKVQYELNDSRFRGVTTSTEYPEENGGDESVIPVRNDPLRDTETEDDDDEQDDIPDGALSYL